MILNLEATSADSRSVWLNAFHRVMTAAGKQRVFEEALSKAAASTKTADA